MKTPCRQATLMSSAAAILPIASFPTLCLLLYILCCPPCPAGVTTRVSVSSDGTEADVYYAGIVLPSISADGRFVAFASLAPNLVPVDTNDASDIFVHDRQIGVTDRVSVASDGTQGNAESHSPSISADGRFVAFCSYASNLVPDDKYQQFDVFVHDRQTGVTEMVSVASDGTQAMGWSGYHGISISGNGRYVAFSSDAPNLVTGDNNWYNDTFVHDRETGVTEMVSVASDGARPNAVSWEPFISTDGRYVTFSSTASNLVSGDTNGCWDVFLHDRQIGVTERVSVSSNGIQGDYDSGNPSISADGRFVAFCSGASNLVTGDTNGCPDIFVRDRQTGITSRISVSSRGIQSDGFNECTSISGDGRHVVFQSSATNLVPGYARLNRAIYVHDRQTGTTDVASIPSSGSDTDEWSEYASISADGRYIAFSSLASNLVAGDTNGVCDIFVRDRWGVGNTKALPDASPAVISAGTVTADLSGCFYVQDADRSSGIKVSWPGAVVAGDRYRIDGFVDTDVNGERYINAWNVRRVDALPVAPLGVRGSLIGGSSLGYDPATGAGQQGITGAVGLNNIGLLIKTWGKVTQIGDNYLYVDDGSGLKDGTLTGSAQNVGVRVICDPTKYKPGDYLTVIGISSCFRTENSLARQILIRSADDIEKK